MKKWLRSESVVREKVTPVSRKHPLRFLGIEKWSEMEPATGLKNQITNELVN